MNIDDDIDVIEISSTSLRSANATPIILKQTEGVQTKFDVRLIENSKDAKKCVSGSLIHEKKSLNS